MFAQLRWPIAAVVLAGLTACSQDYSSSAPQPRVTRSDQDSVEDIARAIQTAPDALAEADALKRLHKHAADHKYTYRVENTQLDTGQRVTGPAAAGVPLRTRVTVLRGEQPVHDFSFTPRDNRNLSLIVAAP